MNHLRITILLGMVAALGACQTTGGADEKSHSRKSVVAGEKIELERFRTMDVDCKSNKLASIVVTQKPSLGIVGTETGLTHSTYKADNPRLHCNSRKHPTRIVTYTSRKGVTGQDHVSYDVIWYDGKVWQESVDINVR